MDETETPHPIRCVYVAGAYDGDCATTIQANMRRGLQLSMQVLRAGLSPFCPWLDWQFGMLEEVTRERYLAYSLDWLRKADAVMVTPGWMKSRGTRAEIREAERVGIPVYFQFDALIEDAKNAKDTSAARGVENGRN